MSLKDKPIIFLHPERKEWTIRMREGFDFQMFHTRIWDARAFCQRLNFGMSRYGQGESPAPDSGRFNGS